ncbi:MICOS complex subunit MIC60-1 [Galendromus occidentalis]|uniref:MICOS complex subunit MIC60 n=1 Tax=Galendromus occidentalis TaxID=34638 RepID=A0AAJ7WGX2_9ACAR|nr:MICOS complex subunit MIC60-1 [Galendromus occidentalis]
MITRVLQKSASAARLSVQRRPQSSQASGGGGGGGVLKLALGVTTAAGAGAIAYARLDPSFAKTVKDNAPFLEPVLDAIGADTSGGASSAPKLPPAESQQSLLKSKPKPAEPVLREAPKKASAAKDETPRAATSEPKDNELQKQKQNFILEQTLRDVTSAAERSSTEAAADLEQAASRTSEYATKLLRALDEATGGDDHFMWKEANEAKDSQSSAQKRAAAKAADASKAIHRLEEAIRKGRADPATKDNINLNQAEQALSKMKKRLETSSAVSSKALENVNLAQQFGDAIEESKKHLIEEVNALLPPGKSFSDPKKLTTDDLNLLVHHAHKKIGILNRELSRMQLTDDEKAKQYRQQLSALDKEVGRQKSEVAKLVAERVSQEREAFEIELQNQLRRQVGVHTEHLREALDDQRQELTRRSQLEVEKAREDERSLQVARLTDAVELLQKMESYLHARKLLDEASKKAKSLWLSCASLKHVLSEGRTDVKNTPQSLAADIIPLKEVSESSEFVKLVLDTIPEKALKRGVYPEVALKERFYEVETACRRVALMEDQNGGGPGRYILSHLMSYFMIYPKPVPQEELEKEQKVNPLMWDTYDILSRVRASLQKEDLEQALRYANQLKGTPRQAAKDWIQEVRLLLETKQAANALMAYAAATVAEDLPKH